MGKAWHYATFASLMMLSAAFSGDAFITGVALFWTIWGYRKFWLALEAKIDEMEKGETDR